VPGAQDRVSPDLMGGIEFRPDIGDRE